MIKEQNIKFVRLIKDETIYVEKGGVVDSSLGRLCWFLRGTVKFNYIKWKNIIKKNVTENGYWTDQLWNDIKTNTISIEGEYDDLKDAGESYFHATPEKLIEIIESWGKLVEQNKKEIIIFKDEAGNVWLEGSDEETIISGKEQYIFIPSYFVIKTYGFNTPPNCDVLDATIEYLNKRLGNDYGKVATDTMDYDGDTDIYNYGIRYKSGKTIHDIAGFFPEFDWRDEGRNFKYLVWERKEGDQIFADKSITKVEISTQ